jgi:hypothetical protein
MSQRRNCTACWGATRNWSSVITAAENALNTTPTSRVRDEDSPQREDQHRGAGRARHRSEGHRRGGGEHGGTRSQELRGRVGGHEDEAAAQRRAARDAEHEPPPRGPSLGGELTFECGRPPAARERTRGGHRYGLDTPPDALTFAAPGNG